MKQEMFTEYGKKTLTTRLESLCKLYGNDNQSYPFKYTILGFPHLQVNNRQELLQRIKELSELLNVNIEISINVKIIEE